MSLGDILDGAFKLFRANLRTVVIITAVLVGPLQVAAALAQRQAYGGSSLLRSLGDPSALQTSSSGSAVQNVAYLLVFLAQLLVLPFVAGAISKVVSTSYLGGEMGPGPALRAVGRRWWAFIVAWFLVHLAEAVGALFCILPGLLAMALFVMVAPSIAVEEIGPLAAMRRSWHLAGRRLFPTLGIALLVGLLASVVGGVLGTVPQALALVIGLRWGWILLAAGSILVSLVTTPFVAIASTLLYFDGRIRHEGFDLQLMAGELSRGAAR